MRYLRLRQVQERVPWSKQTIYRKIKEEQFPRPIKLGTNSVAWSEDEIADWLKAKQDERDGRAA